MIRNGSPLWVIVECSQADNVFRWMKLFGAKAGVVAKPDLERADMWNEKLAFSYDEILRGDAMLSSWDGAH